MSFARLILFPRGQSNSGFTNSGIQGFRNSGIQISARKIYCTPKPEHRNLSPDRAMISFWASTDYGLIRPSRPTARLPAAVARPHPFVPDVAKRQMFTVPVERSQGKVGDGSRGPTVRRIRGGAVRRNGPCRSCHHISSEMGTPVVSSVELAILTGRPTGCMYSLVQSIPSAL